MLRKNAKLAALKGKAEAEATLDRLKKAFEVKKTSLTVAKVKAKESLVYVEKDLEITENKSQKNYKVGMD